MICSYHLEDATSNQLIIEGKRLLRVFQVQNELTQRNDARFAIANKYCFGTPPLCLVKLTEVELAMLTTVNTYGYCFSFTGCCNNQLKGSLSYYKVAMESIARAEAHFDVLNMHAINVVLLHGKITPEQKAAARQKKQIRVNKMILTVMRVCLLRGPERSGKTTVVDLAIEYAREYSSFMENYTIRS